MLEGFSLEARAEGVIVGGSQPTLAWNLSTNPQVVGYAVKSGIAGSVTNVQNAATATSLLLNNLITWKTNFIYVTAYDISGVEWAVSEVLFYYPTTVVSGVTAPVIAAQPSSVVAALGAPVSLAVAASSPYTLSYQWYKNGAAISGATKEVYSFASAQLADSGSYYVLVSNAGGSVASSAASLSVLVPPAIATQPASSVVLQGATVTLSAGATGSDTLRYQWYKDGAQINGATNPSLVLPSVLTSDSGSYMVTVSNPVGQVASAAAVLTVNALPVIMAQPASVVTLKGSSVSFTVAASGAPAPSFQWYKDGVAISGATGATLSLSSVQTTQSGAYTVKVSNSVGYVMSSAASLSVYVTPTISTHPKDVYTFKGSNASFTVVASGVPAPSYQWYKDGVALSGATSPTLAFSNLQGTNSGTYNVKVSNAAGSVTSYNAILSVYLPPTITVQPASRATTQGTQVTLSVVASGSGTLYYQWIKDGTTVVGGTSSNLTFSSVQYADAGNYSVSIVNSAGSVRSSTAQLSVGASPVITTQPASVVAYQGSNVTFSVAATGVPAPTLQWHKDGVALAGATSQTLSLPNVQTTNAGIYTVTASNVGGTATSYNATLTVYAPPVITTQPASRVSTQGSQVTLSVVATGSGKLYYQWIKDGTTVVGGTSSNLTFSSVQYADAGNYSVSIANSAGTVRSSVAALAVCQPPAITAQPASVFAFKGTNVTFSVVATGVPTPALQWYKDGVALAAATNASLYLPNVQSTNAGVYTVTATNIGGKVTSYNATLTVYLPPTITTQPVSQAIPQGSNVTFTVTATGSGNLYYQWSLNGYTLAGATKATLTITNVQSANAGNYMVSIANSAGSVKSSLAALTVTAPLKATLAHQTATTPQPVRLVLRKAPQAGVGATFALATVPGTSYAIQASGNLADWEEIGTLPPATSTETEFSDPDTTAHAMRFYRAVPIQ